jgi:hypothetical protein
LCFLFLLGLSFSEVMAKSGKLRYYWSEGDKYHFKVEEIETTSFKVASQSMDSVTNKEHAHILEVIKVDQRGTATLTVNLDYFSFNMDIFNLGKMVIDSRKSNQSEPFRQFIQFLKTHSYHFKVTNRGKVEAVVGLDNILAHARKWLLVEGFEESQLKFFDQIIQALFGPENVEQTLSLNFLQYPEPAVAKGSQWTKSFSFPSELGDMRIRTDYTLLSDVQNQMEAELDVGLKVDMKLPPEEDMTMKVTNKDSVMKALIDLESGMPKELNYIIWLGIETQTKNKASSDGISVSFAINAEASVAITRMETATDADQKRVVKLAPPKPLGAEKKDTGKLRYRWRKGDRFFIKQDELFIFSNTPKDDMDLDFEVEMMFGYLLEVVEVDQLGTATIQVSPDYAVLNNVLQKPTESDFDSRNPDQSEVMADFVHFIKTCIYRLKITNRGKVKVVSGLDEISARKKDWLRNNKDKWSQSSEFDESDINTIDGIIEDLFNAGQIKTWLMMSFLQYPETALSVGSQWTESHVMTDEGLPVQVELDYTLISDLQKQSGVELSAEIKLIMDLPSEEVIRSELINKDSALVALVDPKTGVPKNVTANLDVEFKVESTDDTLPEKIEKSMTMIVKGSTAITRIDDESNSNRKTVEKMAPVDPFFKRFLKNRILTVDINSPEFFDVYGGYPLRRDDLAKIIKNLKLLGARIIVIDTFIQWPSSYGDDDSLIDVLVNSENVILMSRLGGNPEDRIFQQVQYPAENINKAAVTAYSNSFPLDKTGGSRIFRFLCFQSGQWPVSVLVAAKVLGLEPLISADRIVLGKKEIAIDDFNGFSVKKADFEKGATVPPEGDIETFPGWEILELDRNDADEVEEMRLFANQRIVFLGDYQTYARDILDTMIIFWFYGDLSGFDNMN